MKKRLLEPRFGLFLSLITAALAAILHTVAYLNAYGGDGANYFSRSSPIPKLSIFFAVASCLLAFSATLIRKAPAISVRSPRGNLSSLPAALGFLASGTLMCLSNTTTLTHAVAFFCFLSAVYHVLMAVDLLRDIYVLAFIGFSTVIACILLNGYFYFDVTLEMNAPLKVNVLVGLLVAMIYHVQELRVLMGNAQPRLSIFMNACTVAISGLSAFSIPLAYLLGKFDRTNVLRYPTVMADLFQYPEYLAGAVALLGIFITSSWRLCQGLLTDRHTRIHKEDA